MRAAGSMQRKDLVASDVVLVTEDLRIEGTIHTEPGRTRFSDVWEGVLRGRRSYIPVSDATVRVRDGSREAEQRDVILVEREDVQAAFRQSPDGDGNGSGRHIQLQAVPAGVFCESFRVEGTVHLDPSRKRFSEAWEALIRDARPFVPITDARITDRPGVEVIAETGFVTVDKGRILTGFAVEEEHESTPTRVIQLEAVQASFVIDGLVVTGTIHPKPGEPNFSRFSDLWESLVRDPRTFVAITEASVCTSDGREIARPPFLCVEKAHIRAAYPLPSEG